MFKWIVRAVMMGCSVGLAFGAGISVKHLVKSSPVFDVSNVEVRGVSRTDNERIEKVFKPMVGRNIFTEIAPNALLTEDPWIVKVEMKRVIPDKLVVFVKEERELLRYRNSGKCYAFTELNTEIPVKCEDVHIDIAEMPLLVEFNEFIKLYAENDILKQCNVTLKNGFFLVNTGGMVIKGTYLPGVFTDNYYIFKKRISPRYRNIYHVDVTVRGKVYVKGAI
ncbi:MAG: FtsQ-type POTRA domain-containing protein [Deferribacteraceae bacterium]|jgi:hypothetical protein|nr:FtsQ-type POTRA domain-containing protein [Deferribacteraceae bacterium]